MASDATSTPAERAAGRLQPPVPARRRDYAFAALFLVLWLVPISWVGLTDRPPAFAPVYLQHLYRVACLFTERVGGWSDYYFQVQLEGSESWVTAVQEDYARMKPFGHRTRLHRMLTISRRNERGTIQREQMARFIKTRFEELYPDRPRVVGLRFIHVFYRTGEPELAHPRGRWERPPLAAVDRRRGEVLSSHFFDERRAGARR
jgi:hypothetical protein